MRHLLILLLCAMPALVFAQDVDLPRPRPEPPAATENTTPAATENTAPAEDAPALEAAEPPGEDETAPQDAPTTTPEGEPLPRPRPEGADGTEAVEEPALPPSEVAEPEIEATEPVAPEAEGAPEAEEPVPGRVYQTMCPAVILGLVEAEALPPIAEGECLARSPLSVTAVRVGSRIVPLSSPATLSCEMAVTLSPWAEAIDGVLWARENTRLAQIDVGTTFLCRSRNTAETTDRISEHGFADALDVVGFTLEDGRTITVLEGWAGSDEQGSRILRFAHEAGCSLFSTTLGPEANELHRDHLHLDQGCHGESCTMRLCE